MFDLFRSRAKAVRYLLGALMLLVALSMVVTLIPGFVGSSYAPDNIIAEIGDEVISTRDVQVNIQQQLRNDAFPREMAAAYVPIIINQMISERAVAYQAEQMGFEVTDADVARAVESLLPQLFQGGEFVGRDVYAQYLARMNLTIPEFESNVRKQMLLLRLTNIALEGVIVTQKEIEEEYRRQNEKVKLEYVSISAFDYRTKVKVTRKEMEEYLERLKSTFQIGEKRNAQLLVVDESEIAASVSIPEAELRKAYQASTDRFRTPERVKVRHILLKTTGKSEEETVQIKAKAEDLLARIRGGADFAELARSDSEDTGSAVDGGDLGWVARGQTVQNFENTAFSLEPEEISDVVSTEYGFHIIQLLDKERARLQPFEEVKEQLAGERKKQFVYDRMQSLAEEAAAELAKNPPQAEQIGNKLGLRLINVEQFGAGDAIPELAGSPDVMDAIGALAEGGVSPVMQAGADKLVVATITEVFPPRPAEFSEVRDQIRDRLLTQKTQETVQQKSDELEEKLKTAGNDLGALARSVGLTVMTTPEFSRDVSVEGLGTATYVEEAFDVPVGTMVGPISAMGQTFVCKVISKTAADMSAFPEQRERIANTLRSQKARQRKDLFEDGVLTRLINEGKVKIHDRAIQRLTSVYQG